MLTATLHYKLKKDPNVDCLDRGRFQCLMTKWGHVSLLREGTKEGGTGGWSYSIGIPGGQRCIGEQLMEAATQMSVRCLDCTAQRIMRLVRSLRQGAGQADHWSEAQDVNRPAYQ